VSVNEGRAEAPPTALIGLDWGTTHLRAYRIAAHGQVLERRQSPLGISSLRNREFEAALEAFIGDWRNEPLPMLMCGMIGSRGGWREVPYTTCPASLDHVGSNLVRIETLRGTAWIVGGISTVDARGRYDVMRGEETQIFGTCDGSERRLVVAPGTHSKWAMVRNGAIEHFRTYMTGELYSILSQHSTLAWGAQEGADTDDCDRSFVEGVKEAREDPDLPHSLFTVRTRSLFESSKPGTQAAYLSGILIGSEVLSGLRQHPADHVTVIASTSLGRWYQGAFSALGFGAVEIIDAEQAVVRGLSKLLRYLDTV
jgi:2-dehydro-3-deoxygalactonokinase